MSGPGQGSVAQFGSGNPQRGLFSLQYVQERDVCYGNGLIVCMSATHRCFIQLYQKQTFTPYSRCIAFDFNEILLFNAM